MNFGDEVLQAGSTLMVAAEKTKRVKGRAIPQQNERWAGQYLNKKGKGQ